MQTLQLLEVLQVKQPFIFEEQDWQTNDEFGKKSTAHSTQVAESIHISHPGMARLHFTHNLVVRLR